MHDPDKLPARPAGRPPSAPDAEAPYVPPTDHAATLIALTVEATGLDSDDAEALHNGSNAIHDEIMGLLLGADDVVPPERRDAYTRWLGDQIEQMPLLVRQQLRWETAEQLERLARLAYVLAR